MNHIIMTRHQVQPRCLEQAYAAPKLSLPPAPVLTTRLMPPLQHGNSLVTFWLCGTDVAKITADTACILGPTRQVLHLRLCTNAFKEVPITTRQHSRPFVYLHS